MNAWPTFGPVAYDDTCRLIPGRYARVAEVALEDLADDDVGLDDLVRLAAATNARLQAQEQRHPAGLGPADLVFGIPYSKIVNGAFAYGGEGARFHPPGPRGAWYCALDVETCVAEVAHHRLIHLNETAVTNDDAVYRLFVADIHAQDFALLDDGRRSSLRCLRPDDYAAGQALGARLRAEHRGGVRYPSVRRDGGTCLAVLQAPIVANVRADVTYRLTIRDGALAGAAPIAAAVGSKRPTGTRATGKRATGKRAPTTRASRRAQDK